MSQGDKLSLGTFIREHRSYPHGTGLCVLVALILATVVLLIAGTTSASAAVEAGGLTQLNEPARCIGETKEKVANCETTIPSGLDFAYEIQISPDSKNAYSVAVNGDLTEYSRNGATGALSVIGCFSSKPVTEPACTENDEMNVAAIESPAALAISPDGSSVYVVGQGKVDDLVEFSRNRETGLLTKIGCITHEATSTECATTGAKGLNLPYGVTVSPNGENVYVTAFADEAVAEFKRNTETGVLTQLEGKNNCISDTALSECGTTTAIGLKEAIGVTMSPDGKDLYVGAGARNSEGDIAAFELGSEGVLTQLPGEEACIGEKVSSCKHGAQAEHIDGAEDLLVSPDGNNLYATSYASNAIVELKRTASGALEQLAPPNECVSTEALANCTQAKAIGHAIGVAISPDGSDLYASSEQSSVGSFSRRGEGELTQLAGYPCLTEANTGCEPASSNERIGIQYARRLTVSPDGTNVYVAAQAGHSIAEFARAVTPTVTSVGPKSGSEAGGTGVTISGTGFVEGTTVKFGSTSASNVQVNSGTSITATAPAGTGTAEVTVTTPLGTSAKSPADRYFYALVTQPPGFLGGLGLTQYCKTAGFEEKVGLLKGEVEGPGFAYENWGCEGIKPTALIAETGPAPSMEDACHAQHGASSYGYAENPDSAFSWNCYEDPSVTRVSLAEGPAAGGSPVTITGTNFSPASTVAFGSISATKVTFNSATSITATSPGGAGTVDVRVTTYNGTSATTAADKFTYIRPPSSSNKGGQAVAVISSSVVAPPVLAVSGNVAPVSGTVLVKLPGAASFVPLTSLRNIPFGTIIETTHGKVTVTTVNAHGELQAMTFFEGQFRLTQGKNGMVIAELTGGNFSVCPTARERAHIAIASSKHVSPKHVVRKLWAEGHGSYSTKGNYASGAVLGTRWLTEDLCDGTLIHVATDKVAVTNLVNHRHKTVKAGKSYLAKAP